MGDPNSSGRMIPDRRRASRTPVQAKVTVAFAGQVYSVVTKDLTPQGAFFLTDVSAPVSTRIGLTHDGLVPIDVTGRVVRVPSESRARVGLRSNVTTSRPRMYSASSRQHIC